MRDFGLLRKMACRGADFWLPAVLALFLTISSPSSFASEEITIGVIGSNELGVRSTIVSPTLSHLAKTLPQYRFRVIDIPTYQAVDLVKRTHPDFVVGPADIFFTLINTAGAQPLATRKNIWARDGGASVGSAVIVRADRTDLNSLADLKGGRIAASLPDSLGGWLAFAGEVTRQQLSVDEFTRRTNFVSYEFPAVFESVLDGKADAGVLTACQLELAETSGMIEPGLLRVINRKNTEAIKCRHSTDLYPGQTFGVLDFSRPELTKEVALAVLTMPRQRNYVWQVAGQFHAVAALYRDLHIGPFAQKPWTWREMIGRYYIYIIAAFVLIAFLLLNEIHLNRLVERRTADLSRSLEENRRLAQEKQRAIEQLSLMERNSLVSHMGSMIAHELKQPLATITNYCEVAKIRLEDEDNPVLENLFSSLQSEIQRISGIVDRVRAYARRRNTKHDPLRLDLVVGEALESFRTYREYQEIRPRISTSLQSDCWVRGDKLELEILIINLLKNGSRVAAKSENPEMSIGIEQELETVDLLISDNGPKLTDEDFERLHHATDSTSSDGLGLGLSIVRSIVDAHSAKLSLRQLPERGICFVIRFDRVWPDKERGTHEQ